MSGGERGASLPTWLGREALAKDDAECTDIPPCGGGFFGVAKTATMPSRSSSLCEFPSGDPSPSGMAEWTGGIAEGLVQEGPGHVTTSHGVL